MGKKAILVGCNYPDTKVELHGCVNDVWRMHKCLKERFGFEEEDISVLIDTDPQYPPPTGANIKKAIDKLVSEAQPGDILFVHYSGHGTRLPAETGEHDDTGYDECIVPCDMNLITDEDFRDLVKKIPDGVSYTMIADSCHSGGLIEEEEEQIGDSYKKSRDLSGNGGSCFIGPLSETFCNEMLGILKALEDCGIRLPFGRPRDGDEGDEDTKSRSLPIFTLLEILRQKTGKEDLDVGNIRPALFDMFGGDSSTKVKKFVRVLLQSMEAVEGNGGLLGFVGTLAHEFMKPKIGDDDYMKPALDIQVSDPTAAYAGIKEKKRTSRNTTVLVSGCQSDETSADANPSGKPGQAYGAMSNAIQTVLAEYEGPIKNFELVTRVRKVLAKQGFKQHPGLYCCDSKVDETFIC